MIKNVSLSPRTFFRPLRDTPPVCLTQDLIPELDADILLLGCGDARSILFTLYTDNKRKMDLTCCDIEPGIHARNVLLYTLLIDDNENLNTDKIWNVYFHWKLDRDSLELLETQVRKLLQMSESIDQWHNSIYGPNIRFFDAKSLSAVRQYWQGFVPQDVATSQEDSWKQKQSQGGNSRAQRRRNKLDKNKKTDMRQKLLQDAIDKAEDNKIFGGKLDETQLMFILRSTFPALNLNAITDLRSVSDHWSKRGTLPSSIALRLEPTDLNPAFLYTPNHFHTLRLCSPLNGFPLSTAFTPICKQSAFFVEKKAATSFKQHLVNCVQNHFMLWASSFRRAVANKLILRIFAGDALSFCFTLRNRHLPQSTSIPAAPLNFDIIDTSNLADALGPLNVMTLASSLLKYHDSSCLYAKTLVHYDALELPDRLVTFFGVDIRCMSLFLGLIPPNLFTNATNRLEEDLILSEWPNAVQRYKKYKTQARARIQWKRIRGSQTINNSPFLTVEAEALSKFLVQVFSAMFPLEHVDFNSKLTLADEPSAASREFAKICNPPYNRASFAVLLKVLKENIICDWNECLEGICDGINASNCLKTYSEKCEQELLLNLHIFGVDSSRFRKTTLEDSYDSILAPVIQIGDLPDLVCVTVRVCKEHLQFLTNFRESEIASIITCTFEGKDPVQWSYVFSSIQCTFGKWHNETTNDISYPYIKEDSSQFSGSSDFFVSVMVPTWMLVQSKQSVPTVKCGLLVNTLNSKVFSEYLGTELIFFSSEMTSEDVFITQFMPGSSALPTFPSFSTQEDNRNSDTTAVHLTDDGSQIKSLVKRVCLESEDNKSKLALNSTAVKVDFKSLFNAVVTIWISVDESLEFKVEFPVPVSETQHKIRMARKSLYIEIVSPLFNPLKEEAANFLFPTFLSKTPTGVTVPTPWTASHLDLDVMPQIDLKDSRAISWLKDHCHQTFSKRESLIRSHSLAKSAGKGIPSYKMGNDLRLKMKVDILSFFLLYAENNRQNNCFLLEFLDGTIRLIIYVSCIRLDLANYNVVLDCAIFPFASHFDPTIAQFLDESRQNGGSFLQRVKITGDDNRAWGALMPALVERCRNWQHTEDCEYILVNEVPLSGEFSIPVCSCGAGRFPNGYLADRVEKCPSLKYLLERYGVRAAISPIFSVAYFEQCMLITLVETMEKLGKCRSDMYIIHNKCETCGKHSKGYTDELRLMTCSKCKIVTYCSKECQEKDWKQHKSFCKPGGRRRSEIKHSTRK